jgi:hypothetical protein
MSDPENKRALRTLAAKPSQRLPDRQRDLLHQLFSNAGYRLIAVRQSRNGGPVVTEDPVELLIQRAAALAHDSDLAGELIHG